ncbi:MAG: methionine biosynthesis protein MetW [Armatimonadota bacterium]
MRIRTTETIKPEFRYIVNMVEPGSRVLDLGCGEGQLMKTLQKYKNARIQGIELSPEAVQECVAKGLFVYQGDLDEGLADFNDKSFDYVILTSTLQVLHKPNLLIAEATRVGKKCIVSIPNFAYWRIRFQLMFNGVMPKTKSLPYEWYDSPNIHHTTIKDLTRLFKENNMKILNQIHLVRWPGGCKKVKIFPNFFADYGIFEIER